MRFFPDRWNTNPTIANPMITARPTAHIPRINASEASDPASF
ncbi:uncharacterized protein METZ01_LOCUS471771, partial [marine metagenome]